MKKVQGVYSAPARHWVGNGFYVSSMFSYNSHGKQVSPFLLLDHSAPKDFEPTEERRGVGTHPHRGFETVTIVYDGEVEHKDSTGAGGVIGKGDVQWMTAGAGILHEEFHSEAFSKTGGTVEMAQLWVNLPAEHKMTKPRYQDILTKDIPELKLENEAGTIRLIAGDYAGISGPAMTFSPLKVMDLRLNAMANIELELPDGWTAALAVLQGTVQVNGEAIARDHQLVVMHTEGEKIAIEANNDAKVLLLSGEPIDEPIVGYGPFVMNSEQEIRQAMQDYSDGNFGAIPRQ